MDGLSKLLERLFRHSPPTAPILDEVPCYIAAAEFLARRGIKVPEQAVRKGQAGADGGIAPANLLQ